MQHCCGNVLSLPDFLVSVVAIYFALSFHFVISHLYASLCLRRCLHDNASYEYGDRLQYWFSPKFRCSVYTKSFYQRKLIIHVECGRAVLAKQFSTMRLRKCNFVVDRRRSRALLTFLASMKVIRYVYIKSSYVSVQVSSLPLVYALCCIGK